MEKYILPSLRDIVMVHESRVTSITCECYQIVALLLGKGADTNRTNNVRGPRRFLKSNGKVEKPLLHESFEKANGAVPILASPHKGLAMVMLQHVCLLRLLFDQNLRRGSPVSTLQVQRVLQRLLLSCSTEGHTRTGLMTRSKKRWTKLARGPNIHP